MVGDHQQDRVGGHLRHHLADDRVHLLVGLEDRVAPLRRPLGGVERALGVEVAVHHVLHPVGELEVVDQQVPVVVAEQAVEHLRELVRGVVDVLEEGLLVDRAVGHRPGVDRPADGLEQPEAPGQVVDEAARGGDGEQRRQVLGIELDRRQVEAHLGVERQQAEAADAVELDQRVEREGEAHPVAPLPRLELEVLAGDVDPQRRAVGGDGQRHRDGDVGALVGEELVGRPLDLGVDRALVVHQVDDLERDVGAPLGLEEQLGGEIERLADSKREVGGAQAGKQLAVRVGLGREGHRHPHHLDPLAGPPQHLPEGVALLAVDDRRPLDRQQAGCRHPGAGAGHHPEAQGDQAGHRQPAAEERPARSGSRARRRPRSASRPMIRPLRRPQRNGSRPSSKAAKLGR